jgi:hypothetical protein
LNKVLELSAKTKEEPKVPSVQIWELAVLPVKPSHRSFQRRLKKEKANWSKMPNYMGA